MTQYKLSEVEAFRAQVLLEESSKKLQFLTRISGRSGGDELTQFMGEEISRIIQEQRYLEKTYEELIAQRGNLKGLTNKAEFRRIQREIADVSTRLKDSNKNLCRNLKENPDVKGNISKLQAERSKVADWLEWTKNDLIEMSFANLVARAETERKEQERLNEVKKKERESSTQVQQLQTVLQREHADHEKETKSASLIIKDLKEELHRNKTISEIEFRFEQNKLRAQEQALTRIHAQMEKKLWEELRGLEGVEEMEKNVHGDAHIFLEGKLTNLQGDVKQWEKNLDRETNDREVEMSVLKDRRQLALSELTDLKDKRNVENQEHQAKELEMRNAVLIEKQQRDQLERMREAVIFLQDEGRRYMERLALRNAAKKGGKKKGKKK